ncbi:AAA domain-containing protein [Schlesneria paludicola]|uniref:AAA domain-containing protein n=1 Tax=Schlesneria paludicola TaxID=360056 RepID=UPI00029AE8BC|nr:AAA domain-containing protein [Schlesneria paludicola]
MSEFQKLIRCLELEAAAVAEELVIASRRAPSEQAELTGSTLVGLAIRDETPGFGGRTVVTLGKRDRRLELPWTRLRSGMPVVLSVQQADNRTGWRGIVTWRDRDSIAVVLSDSPETEVDRPLYRLDMAADDVARERQRSALRRIGEIDRGRALRLKQAVLGKEPPEFDAVPDWSPLAQLDESQQAAVSHALSAQHLAVIHGPPGTGKTTTVVELIRQAVRRGEKVLACAASNLAVDNLLERLVIARERVIRIGHPARVLPELREHTLDVMVESHPDLKLAREWTKEAWSLRRQAGKFTRTAPPPGARRDARDEAKRLLRDARELESRLVEYLLDSAQVVCATLTGLNDEILGERQFDLVVIDEAAQSTEPPCWIPLLRSKRLVLAGDHCQLPPTIISHDARREGFQVSMMERLVSRWGDLIARRLDTQYRMHDRIMQFSSDEFYDSSLISANSVRAHRLADLPHVTDGELTQSSIRFFDTAGSDCVEQAEVEGESRTNPGEAEFVVIKVNELLAAGVRPTEIAVITPYSAQARLLRTLIAEAGVEIDTVDGFQGREKEAVVISLVRSNAKGELGFLTDTRRMNVALTRARRHLMVFGDSATLANHEFYLRMLNYFERQDAYGTVWEIS